MRNKGRQARSVLTVNGRLQLRRTRWHDADGCVAPGDAWLDDAERTVSEGVREMICRLNQDATSFGATAANLERTACLRISREQVRQLVEAEGKEVLSQMRRGELTSQACHSRRILSERGYSSRSAGDASLSVDVVAARARQAGGVFHRQSSRADSSAGRESPALTTSQLSTTHTRLCRHCRNSAPPFARARIRSLMQGL